MEGQVKAFNRLALKEWSVVVRVLHEGSGILTFLEDYIPADREFFLLPTYERQREEALKPSAGMSYRHELRPPLAGHVYIRDYAEVAESFEVQSLDAVKVVDREHPFTLPEMKRRLESAPAGLVALALRAYRLPRPRRITERQKYEDGERFQALPEEIATDGAAPALSAEVFGHRLAVVRRALGDAADG